MWKRVSIALTWRAKLWITGKDPEYFKRRPTSAISADIWKSRTNDRLLDLIYAAIPVMRQVSHADIAAKMQAPPYRPEIWPGEKYKLLTAIVAVVRPKLVIEIGTSSGLSALSLKKTLPDDGKIVTFDIRPWNTHPLRVLSNADFEDGRLVQIVDDISDKHTFDKHASLLSEASLVFIDVGRDEKRREEKKFLENFAALEFKGNPIFILNDIRLDNMLNLWHDLQRPKLEVTTFGHWSGNGLVDWNG
ncbi:MAG TPA: hypothetical protein VG737_07870 [Cyclobacteriaceae bacterium]|nr:hypothetical protein [Cyclobacteriaceae bacterium]